MITQNYSESEIVDMRRPYTEGYSALVGELLSKLELTEDIRQESLLNGHQSSLLKLKNAYAEWLNRVNREDHLPEASRVSKENIALFESSTQVIEYLVKLFFKTNNGKNLSIQRSDSGVYTVEDASSEPDSNRKSVLITPPTYFGLVDAVGDLADIEQEPTLLADDHKITPEFKQRVIKKLENQENAPNILWLCSPNNPTGISWTLDDLEDILKSAKYTWVIVDQAFLDLIDADNKNSAAQLIKKYPNLIVTRSFSKGFGLPDKYGKVGLAIADQRIIEELETLFKEDNKKISDESLQLAIEALKDIDFLRKNAQRLKEEIAFIYNAISSINIWWRKQRGDNDLFQLTPDSEIGVLLMRATMGRNLLDLCSMLDKYKIKVLNTNADLGLENGRWVRLCLQDRETNILFIAGLLQIISDLLVNPSE